MESQYGGPRVPPNVRPSTLTLPPGTAASICTGERRALPDRRGDPPTHFSLPPEKKAGSPTCGFRVSKTAGDYFEVATKSGSWRDVFACGASAKISTNLIFSNNAKSTWERFAFLINEQWLWPRNEFVYWPDSESQINFFISATR